MVKKYEFKLEKYDEGLKVRIINYKDDDRTFKRTTPLNNQDKMIVENLKGLLKKLDSNELKVKMEIK